jgi:glycerol-3-phosphate O-acyltransferase / dihydroxyacetone phosphate acyltransferase
MYFLFRQLTRLLVFFYFKKIVVTGEENIPDKGPLLVVANHPNTMMDPMIIGTIIPQQMGFVANAGIFTNKVVAAVLRYFHVIPIYRKKDVGPNEKPNNTSSFVQCHKYLSRGNRLLIFPEGSSYYELKLREIKTGTARIALSFEAQNNFNGNLKILPIALDYSDSIQFRSMVSITISKPISVSEYRNAYVDEVKAVNTLTENIRKALAPYLPYTEAKEEESLLIKLHKIYTAYVEPAADMHLNPARSLQLRVQLAHAMKKLKQHNQSLYQKISNQINQFFEGLEKEKLTTGFLSEEFTKLRPSVVLFGYFILLLVLFPLYVIGAVINYLPYILPAKIFHLLRLDIEYKTTVQIFTGMITFPLFYSLAIWFFTRYVYPLNLPWLLLPVLFILSGYATLFYWNKWRRFLRVIHFYYHVKPETKLALSTLCHDLLLNLSEARKLLSQNTRLENFSNEKNKY